jgi:hypothetical protein
MSYGNFLVPTTLQAKEQFMWVTVRRNRRVCYLFQKLLAGEVQQVTSNSLQPLSSDTWDVRMLPTLHSDETVNCEMVQEIGTCRYTSSAYDVGLCLVPCFKQYCTETIVKRQTGGEGEAVALAGYGGP